jgi:glycosyltransferase involved in cell wall biosynthesis
VAIVHDYLTQQGGAERVVLALMRAFPDAELHTSLYNPSATFPEFRRYTVRTMPINTLPPLRRHHRAALPLLAPSFSSYRVDADLVICSSSGWAHGVRAKGRKVVYCHAPARWLYQSDLYLALGNRVTGGRRTAVRAALGVLKRPLMSWDGRAAQTAAMYIVNSRKVQRQVHELYGIDAHVIAPPVPTLAGLPEAPIPGIEPGFLLCVSRLLPYKNVDVLLKSMSLLRGHRLVIAGAGPEESRLRALSPPNAKLVGNIGDDQLAWLYHNCRALIAPSYEDFGLAPIEAAAFGKPSVALAWGGFLETIRDGELGVLFEDATPESLAEAVQKVSALEGNAEKIVQHSKAYSEPVFASRFRKLVDLPEAPIDADRDGSS